MNDPCGCCEGIEVLTPMPLSNPPGLEALTYRVGTYATFLETMKARLSDSEYAALAKLTTRASDDMAIALLDAWAVVADVLTFYQERIANEGYLRTATERHSVLELAQLVGYSLRPGVAASAYLAFTVEDGYTVELETGIRAQTIPNPGELPQSFETSEPLLVSAEWNHLKPRLVRPQRITPQTNVLYIQGTATRLNPNDPILINPEAVNPGDVNESTDGFITPSLYRVETVTADLARDRTAITIAPWQAAAPDITPPPTNAPVDVGELVNQLAAPIPESAIPPKSRQQLGRSLSASFTEFSDLNLQLITQSQSSLKSSLYQAWSQANVTTGFPVNVYALRLKAAPYGSSAPLRAEPNRDGTVTQHEWDLIAAGELITESLEITLTWREDFSYGYAMPFGVITIAIRISEFPTQTEQRSLQTEQFFIDYPEADETIAVAADIQTDIQTDSRDDVHSEFTFFHLRFDFRQRGTVIEVDFDTQGQLRVATEETNPTTVIQAMSEISTPIAMMQFPGSGTHLLFDETDLASAAITEQMLLIRISGSLQWLPNARSTEQADILSMDATYSQILPGSWIALERPSDRDDRQNRILIDRVKSVSDRARTDYGITAQSTQIQLHQNWLDLEGEARDEFRVIRDTTIFAHSEALELAPAPIDSITEPICGHVIELDRLVSGLESGRWLIVTGERTDIPGVSGIIETELVMLAGIEQIFDADLLGDRPHSILHLGNDLAYCYKRDTVIIYGNVVKSTHGETRTDVLGSGDGSQPMQQFTLPQSPLTHVAAPTAKGAASTLQVSVNDIIWHEVENLVYLKERDRGYMTRTDAEGKTSIIFGNGQNGARLPTGLENIKAVYRTGIGQSGNAQAQQISLLLTRPLGLREVINPMRASGGADPESRDQARRNIPLAVMALDRLVSVPDYADFARTFAGIAKASAVSLSDGRREIVHLTIAGVNDIPIDITSDLYRNFVEALHRLGDPYQPAQVDIRELMILVISAQIHLLPDYLWEGVEPQIRAALLNRFSFDQQDLGEDVIPSHVIYTMQRVPGVAAVDLDVLGGIPEKLTDMMTGKRRLLTPKEISAQAQQIIAQSGQQPKNQPSRVTVNVARTEAGTIAPAQIAFLHPNLPDTLILMRVEP